MKLTFWQRIKRLFGWKPPVAPSNPVLPAIDQATPAPYEDINLRRPGPRVERPMYPPMSRYGFSSTKQRYDRRSMVPPTPAPTPPPMIVQRVRDDSGDLDLLTAGIAIGRAMRSENHLDYERPTPEIPPFRSGGGGDFGGGGGEFADPQPWGGDKQPMGLVSNDVQDVQEQVKFVQVFSSAPNPMPAREDPPFFTGGVVEEDCRRASYSPAPAPEQEPERASSPAPEPEPDRYESSSGSSSDDSGSDDDT